MIRYNPKIWFAQIFQVAKSDTLRILWKEMILLAGISYGLCYVVETYLNDQLSVLKDMVALYSIIGFVLSLLLVFRTNTAYDRWWEGRKKWGELVNSSRNLALKIQSFEASAASRSLFRRMIPNYAMAMKEHLRSGVKLDLLELEEAEADEIASLGHKPNYLAGKMFAQLQEDKQEGKIGEMQFLSANNTLTTFTDILGACERIRNTPMPFSYNLFLKKFIFIYVITLPFAFFHNFGYYTILISIFIFYVLVSIEILAEEIEDPFGEDDNDLPTDDLSRKIRDNVREILKP